MRKISENRTFIMGFAILCIMFCHNTVKWNYIAEPWLITSNLAQCGVDIFLFLSGFGLYYSYSEQGDYLSFVKRRLIKILPTYLIIITVWSVFCVVFGGSTVKELLWRYSLISFYVDADLNEWFITAIITLYVIFPLVYKIAQNEKTAFITMLLCWGGAIVIAMSSDNGTLKIINEIFIVRIPTFVLGVVCGRKSKTNSPTCFDKLGKGNLCVSTVFVLVLCLAYYYWNKENFWTGVRILYCPLSLLICLLFGYLGNCNICNWEKICSLLGTITLELYLIHEKILYVCDIICKRVFPNQLLGSIVSNVVALIISVTMSLIFPTVYSYMKTVRWEKGKYKRMRKY